MRLKAILVEAIRLYDFKIICGHRGKLEQDDAFNNNKSQVKWPNSKHNVFPSIAVDLAPYPIDWNNTDEFVFMCGIIEAIAKQQEVELIFGYRWSFKDYGHIELVP